MQYTQFANTNLNVSKISFGCMSLSADKSEEGIRLLQMALEGGINYFDTADLYEKGANEEMVGKALQGRRQEAVIATKVGNRWRTDGSGWDWTPRKDYILTAVDDSLRRLKTDYIDLYQLHGGTIDDPIDEVVEAFERLQEAGKIRYYGISSIRPNVVEAYLQQSGFSSDMTQYSLLDRRPEEYILPALKTASKAVIVRGALAKGLLAGKPVQSYLDHSEEGVGTAQETVKLHSRGGRTAAQTAMQWVLAHPAVTTIAAGIRTEAQLQEALTALDVQQLDTAAIANLKEAVPATSYASHRQAAG